MLPQSVPRILHLILMRQPHNEPWGRGQNFNLIGQRQMVSVVSFDRNLIQIGQALHKSAKLDVSVRTHRSGRENQPAALGLLSNPSGRASPGRCSISKPVSCVHNPCLLRENRHEPAQSLHGWR